MRDAKIILVLGGARSGKSDFANKLATGISSRVIYVATGQPLDAQMHERISMHKNKRHKNWRTIEEPLNPSGVIKRLPKARVILLDCLTLLVSNLLLADKSHQDIYKQARTLIKTARFKKDILIVVSNEVGMGIVPDNALARDFRDAAGKVNQLIAKAADEVYLMVAGIGMKIK